MRVAQLATASCFCKMPMICFSVRIARFIARSFLWENFPCCGGKIPWQVTISLNKAYAQAFGNGFVSVKRFHTRAVVRRVTASALV